LLEAAIAKASAAEFSPAFLKAEWEAIVNFWGIGDEAAYLGASRKGRGTRLTARQRRAIWRVFTELLAVLEEKHYMTWERLCFRLAAELADQPPPYQHVIADEAQDFGPAEFCLLRALAVPGDNNLFLCGDAGQRIYQPRFSWKAAGIEVRGRATRLTVNYRTTEQIRRFADTLLPAALDEDGDGKPELRASISLLKGPPPEVSGYAGVNEEIAGVARHSAILILAISPVLGYEGAYWKRSGLGVIGGGSSRTGTTRPGSKLRSMNVIKSSQLAKHR
jgi:superfamily I DNA/RNA helicase